MYIHILSEQRGGQSLSIMLKPHLAGGIMFGQFKTPHNQFGAVFLIPGD